MQNKRSLETYKIGDVVQLTGLDQEEGDPVETPFGADAAVGNNWGNGNRRNPLSFYRRSRFYLWSKLFVTVSRR